MGTPGPDPQITLEETLRVFTASDQSSSPLTATEAADDLGCTRRTAHRKLMQLSERGDVDTKKVGAHGRVWWRPIDAKAVAVNHQPDVEADQFGEFIKAVEDYAIFTLDPDGYIASWNEGDERIQGYTEAEILGEHVSIFYTDDEISEGVPGRHLETARSAGHVKDEGWRVREDGSTFWASVVITAVRDDGGELQGFTTVTRDMSEQKEYEQRLEQERRLTERILETVPVSISMITPEGEFIHANPRALERLGIEASDLENYSVDSWDIYNEAGEPIAFDEGPWAQLDDTGDTVSDYECQVDLPDIGRRWLSLNVAPLGGDEPDDTRIVITVDDITEQKEYERQLRRERNQTEELLRTAPIAISVKDADDETRLANQRAQELLGLSEQEIIDEPDNVDEWAIFDADGEPIDPEESPLDRVYATGEPIFDEEIAIESPTGERTWLSLNAAPIFDADGTLDRVITAGEDITPIKRREQLLTRHKNELETELSEILNRISDGFYALDDEWRFTHVNDRAENLLQHSRAELIGKRIWDIFPEAGETDVWDQFHMAMETNDSVSFAVFYDALGRWFEINIYPSETGLSIYFQDATERKEYEQELERYHAIVETVDDGIYTVDPEGQFTMVNEAYVEMTGYSREELIGSHVSLIVDEDVSESAQKVERELRAGEREEQRIEAEMKRADGGTVPAEATFTLLPTNEEYERVGVVRDITERKARERALEESERRYRTLAENFPEGVVALFNEDLRYTAGGGQLFDKVDTDPEEAIGSTIWERYPDDLATEIEPHFVGALAGEAASFEAEYLGRHLQAYTLPVRNADDEVYAGMLVVQDITERIEYRNKLEETVDKLEESNERLKQFAYAASHDLQEPLRMVSSYLQLLEDRYSDNLDADAHEFIEYAVNGSDRMREMINDLLTFSRLDSEAKPLEPTDVDAVIDRVLDQLQLQIEEHGAKVMVENLPMVAADDNQLEQVFQNLISNALKYRGDESPEIEIGAERDAGMWQFHLADNGIGMNPDQTDKIFEVFKRLHNHGEYPGTGIGLALCKKIVDRHGGDLWVESKPDEGSTFYFTMPTAAGHHERSNPSQGTSTLPDDIDDSSSR